MADNIKIEDLVEKPVAPTSEVTQPVIVEPKKEEPTIEQDPLKVELDRVTKTGRTEKEKAEFTLRKTAERVKALGGDPTSILGINEDPKPNDEDDDKPLTIGMYKKIQQEGATKTAFQLADEIQNETEKELVKYHLENSIKSTGNPDEDLKLARALTNAVKNSQIIEESARKTPPKTFSNSSGVEAKKIENTGELEPHELPFLGKPFNMTKEAIIKDRQHK